MRFVTSAQMKRPEKAIADAAISDQAMMAAGWQQIPNINHTQDTTVA